MFQFPTATVLFSRSVALAKIWIWAVPGLLILACFGAVRERRNLPFLLFTASALTTLIGYLFFRRIRVTAGAIGISIPPGLRSPLLATAHCTDRQANQMYRPTPPPPHPELFENQATKSYIATCIILTLVMGVGFRAWQMQGFMANDLKQVPQYQGTEHRVVIIDSTFSFYGADLVQNDPWLRGNEIRMFSHGSAADTQMMQQNFRSCIGCTATGTARCGRRRRHRCVPPPCIGALTCKRPTVSSSPWFGSSAALRGDCRTGPRVRGPEPRPLRTRWGRCLLPRPSHPGHGRRPFPILQFDHQMHVPEGSLVTWPWAYDWTLSLIVRLGLALHVSQDPMAILDHLPVVGFVIAETLMLVICRQLRISVWGTLIALLATAFFPLNQIQYAVGNFHHHFAEHLFVLGGTGRGSDLAAPAGFAGSGLSDRCGARPQRRRAHRTIHSAGTAGLRFCLDLDQENATAAAYPGILRSARGHDACGRLAVARSARRALRSLYAVVVPGVLRRLHGSLLRAAVAAATVALSIALLCIAAVVMALPALGVLIFAEQFVTNGINGMDTIGEVHSPWYILLQPGGVSRLISNYSALIFLLPATLVYSGWRLWRETQRDQVLFWMACVLGLVLVMQQIRMNYFGSFALYLPWILAVDERARRAVRPGPSWRAWP